MADWPWQTIWAAVNAVAAVGAAIGAWLAFRVALAAYRAEHRPNVILTRAHGKTSVDSVGRGTAFNLVLVGHLGKDDTKAVVIASALSPQARASVSDNAVDYSINYGNAIFFSDSEENWYWTRAIADRNLSIADNVTFKQETFPIAKAKVPKDVTKALSTESVLDWLQRRMRE